LALTLANIDREIMVALILQVPLLSAAVSPLKYRQIPDKVVCHLSNFVFPVLSEAVRGFIGERRHARLLILVRSIFCLFDSAVIVEREQQVIVEHYRKLPDSVLRVFINESRRAQHSGWYSWTLQNCEVGDTRINP
jgi:hypothetical protein